jgi:hypothetical protein
MRVGITGHRGLPEETSVLVRAEIEDIISGHAPHELIGVSCLADGPDAWFACGVLDHGSPRIGGPLHRTGDLERPSIHDGQRNTRRLGRSGHRGVGRPTRTWLRRYG